MNNGSDSQLHIFCERKEAFKLAEEFLGCNLCVSFRHAYVGMSQHLAYRFNRHALFKRDERGKSVSCGMRGKVRGDTCPKSEGFQI